MTKDELNTALLSAHTNATNAHNKTYQLADLYYRAYELMIDEDATAGYFYLSNAYVYALESDHSNVNHIETVLKNAGRL